MGVIFLVADSVLEYEADVSRLLSTIGVFVGASALALTIHFFLVLPLLFLLIVRTNPYVFLRNQLPAYVNVMGHSSRYEVLGILALYAMMGKDCWKWASNRRVFSI